MNKMEKNFKKLKNDKKYNRRMKKKEELPSFLLNLSDHEFERNVKPHLDLAYSSPVFFGDCKQMHPIFHPINFSGQFQALYSGVSEDSVRSNFFKTEDKIKKRAHAHYKIHRPKKTATTCVDTRPHRCPGIRKTFFPDITVFTPDLGQTTSVIEGETFREIPFRKIKNTTSGVSQVEAENVMLSDIKEKNRDALPYEQRMAHNHFPKEFITVKLIGPVIPASITITKMPTKRKRLSEFNFDTKKKIPNKESDKKVQKIQDIRAHHKTPSKEKLEEKATHSKEETVTMEEEEAVGEEMGLEEKPKPSEVEVLLGEGDSQTHDEMVIDDEEFEEEEELEFEQEERGGTEEAMIADEGENTEDDKGE